MSPDARATFRLLTDAGDKSRVDELLRDAGISLGLRPSSDSEPLVFGAFGGDRLIGATTSSLGPDEPGPARVDQDRLHVTAIAVEEPAAGRGLGGMLMRLQRLMALQRGLQLACWEQDPLDGRLSHLAIHKLGAVSRRVLAPGSGEQGWKLDVEWWVASARVKGRLSGARPEMDLAHALKAGTPSLNAGWLDDGGLLHPTGGDSAPTSAAALVEVPCDTAGLEAKDPGLALEWRAHLEGILGQAFGQGYWLTDYLRLPGERAARAYYLLVDGERTLG